MHYRNLLAVVFTVASIASFGCTRTEPVATTPPLTDQTAQAGPNQEDEAPSSDMEKMKQTLAKLSETDRVAAEKQHMCPVSGEMLGTMGVPPKVSVREQEVFICCAGCKEKLLNDPDTYLAKLSQ